MSGVGTACAVATLMVVTSARAATPPVPSSLSVHITPTRVVLGNKNATATVDISMAETSARAGVAGLRVEATAGKIVDLRPLGGGHFRAVLEPPSDRFPQISVVSVADIAAVDANHAPQVQVAVVAFAAPLELKGTSEPKVHMVIDIGAQHFGPVTTDDQGRFSVPVVVEPGEGWALATASDALGNISRSRINLYLPAVQRLQAYVFPEILIADGIDTGWVYVTSLGPTGAPRATAIGARAERGHIIKSEVVAPGLTRFAYQAPRETGHGSDTLTFVADSWHMSATSVVPLAAGPPASLIVTVTPSPAPADGHTPTQLRIVARDGSGNPAAGHRVSITLDDNLETARETEPGTYELELAARQRAGHAAGQIRVQPQARRCLRPRALAKAEHLWVIDRRGIACLGELTGMAADGATQWKQHIAAGDEHDGVASPELREGLLLVFTDAEGGQHVVMPPTVTNDERPTLASAIEQPLELAWRVPVPAELRLTTLERNAGGAVVRLNGRGIDNLALRAHLEAAGATVRQTGQGENYVDYTLNWPTGQTVDVLATDSNTGISAWLRLE